VFYLAGQILVFVLVAMLLGAGLAWFFLIGPVRRQPAARVASGSAAPDDGTGHAGRGGDDAGRGGGDGAAAPGVGEDLAERLHRQQDDWARERADLIARLGAAERQAAESEQRVAVAERQVSDAERRVAEIEDLLRDVEDGGQPGVGDSGEAFVPVGGGSGEAVAEASIVGSASDRGAQRRRPPGDRTQQIARFAPDQLGPPAEVGGAGPAESAVEPAESAVEPAESAVEPAESAVEPAESAAEPTQSVEELAQETVRLREELTEAERRAAKISSRLAIARTEAEEAQREVVAMSTRLDRRQAEWAAEKVQLTALIVGDGGGRGRETPTSGGVSLAGVGTGGGERPAPAHEGEVYRGMPAITALSGDNLKEIVGIGDAVESRLHALGIISFRQLAVMGDADVDRLARRLEGFGDRIVSDDWVGQARELQARYYGGLA
jgi:hypothetical protein